MSDSVHAQFMKLIRQLKNDGREVFDVDRLIDLVDVTEVPLDDVLRDYKMQKLVLAMAHCNLRSVERGAGYWVDYEATDNPVFLQRLLKNVNTVAEKNESSAEMLRTVLKSKLNNLPDYSQRAFAFDENGKPVIIDELSRSDVIEMLKRAAGED